MKILKRLLLILPIQMAVSSVLAGGKPISFANRRSLYLGWAQEAHPDMSENDFTHWLNREKSFGLNLAWVGHNNPGEVNAQAVEPALSFAIYFALKNPQSPLHDAAQAMAAAQKRFLDAARKVGMKVVFPVGYQIQMGAEWNALHPDALRRTSDQKVLNAGGISANWIHPDYQKDITDYYRWVYKNYIRPYKDVIVMVNLADEPAGADYSPYTKQVFESKFSNSWEQAVRSDEGQAVIGSFENRYIPNYARWSADVWRQIDSDLPVTMSFCGIMGRYTDSMPEISDIFMVESPNFNVTFDMYLVDGPPEQAVDRKLVTALVLFTRQISELSHQSGKNIWFWPNANSWGLGQASATKSDISDALFNIVLLKSVAEACRAHLKGLAIWNLDVKGQGLFRDAHRLCYDPEKMFQAVSQGLHQTFSPARLRQDVLIWIPDNVADELIGERAYDYPQRIFLMDVYAPLLENGVLARLDASPDADLLRVKTVFLISKYSPTLSSSQIERVMRFVGKGGTLVCNYPVFSANEGRLSRIWAALKFRWTLACSTLTGKPGMISYHYGKGEEIILCGQMKKWVHNVVKELPREWTRVHLSRQQNPLAFDNCEGVLFFPLEKGVVLYNTDPRTVIGHPTHPFRGRLVLPDGQVREVSSTSASIVMPYGS